MLPSPKTVTRALLLSVCLSSTATQAFGYIRTKPGLPRAGEPIVVEIGGSWGDTTYPQNAFVERQGDHFIIRPELPSGGGMSAVMGWSLERPIGALQSGVYTISVMYGTHVQETARFEVLPVDSPARVLVPGYTSDPLLGVGDVSFESRLHLSLPGEMWQTVTLYPLPSPTDVLESGLAGRLLPRLPDPAEQSSGAGRILWLSPPPQGAADSHLGARVSHTLTSRMAGDRPYNVQMPVADEREMLATDFDIALVPVDPLRYRYTLRIYHTGVGSAGVASVRVGQENHYPFRGTPYAVAAREHEDRSYPHYATIRLDEKIRDLIPTRGPAPEFVTIRIRPETPGLYYALLTLTENATGRVLPFAP